MKDQTAPPMSLLDCIYVGIRIVLTVLGLVGAFGVAWWVRSP